MRVDDLVIEVRDKNLVRRGQIPAEVLDLTGTPVVNGVGQWTLRLPLGVPAVADLVALLRTPGSGLVVTHTDPTVGVLWSGPMTSPDLSADTGDPAGTVVVRGVTDDVILWQRLAYPTPGTDDVAAQTTGWDVRAGVAETVMRAYVNANLGPGAPLARRVPGLTLAPDLGRGAAVTYSARMDVLGDVLATLADVGGVQFRLVQVDDHLELQVSSPMDRTGLVRLDLANGTLSSQSVKVARPTVTRAIVAGQGEGPDRTIIERTTAASLASEAEWGLWGRVEEWIDQRQTDDPAELAQAGDKRLAEGGVTVTSVTAVPADDLTMPYPTAWGLGDLITVVVDGQETTATVTSAQVIVGPGGVRVGAGIGPVAGWQPPATRADVGAVTARVSALERNASSAARGLLAASPPSPPADQTVASTAALVTGAAVTVDVIAGHSYRVQGRVGVTATTAGWVTARLIVGNGTERVIGVDNLGVGYWLHGDTSEVVTPSADATWTTTLSVQAQSSTVVVQVGSAQVSVEDITRT